MREVTTQRGTPAAAAHTGVKASGGQTGGVKNHIASSWQPRAPPWSEEAQDGGIERQTAT